MWESDQDAEAISVDKEYRATWELLRELHNYEQQRMPELANFPF